MHKLMCAGPTQVRENVRLARAMETTNPDLDPAFFVLYKEIGNKLKTLLHTKHDIHILSGEGILGLEAAVASLTQPKDRVLVIENGIFGEGFEDFIKLYQGEAVFFHGNKKKGIDITALEEFLAKDHDFVYATLVHVDTPSGVCNDVQSICKLLHKHNILSVVDSVAGMFGEELDVDDAHIDILCGGSQKVVSAPPGLTLVAVSNDAWACMEQRTTPIAGFYVNLLNFKNVLKEEWFPYTMPISDIYGFRLAIENIIEDPQILQRHKLIASATRKAIVQAGLSLYLDQNHASTVTVIEVPALISAQQLLDDMLHDYHIMISGAFSYLKDKVIRIGHMGENCNQKDVSDTLYALQYSLNKQGFECTCDIKEVFLKAVQEG